MTTTTRHSPPRSCRWFTTAAEALAGFEPGVDVFGMFRGEVSLATLVRAVLDQIGPADVTISTWTAASKELADAGDLVRDGRLRSVRWLLDFSFPRRQPRYCAELLQRFGAGSVRLTKSHCKFVLFAAGDRRIVLRTSANLNKNPRFEFFEISEDPEMFEFLDALVEEVWNQEHLDPLACRPSEVCAQWEDMKAAPVVEDDSQFGADLSCASKSGMEILR